MRALSNEEKIILAAILRAESERVDSPDLAPVNVNIVIDPDVVRRGVKAAQQYWLDHPAPISRSTEDLVVSILKAAMDGRRGHTQDSNT